MAACRPQPLCSRPFWMSPSSRSRTRKRTPFSDVMVQGALIAAKAAATDSDDIDPQDGAVLESIEIEKETQFPRTSETSAQQCGCGARSLEACDARRGPEPKGQRDV